MTAAAAITDLAPLELSDVARTLPHDCKSLVTKSFINCTSCSEQYTSTIRNSLDSTQARA